MTIEQSNFLALWKRAANIKRWPLQTNLTENNDATHSFEVAVIAHLLGTIEKDVFNLDTDPDKLAAMAIFHEASEVAGLGDINSNAKNMSAEVHASIKQIEKMFELKMLDGLPPELKPRYETLIIQPKDTRDAKLVKVADDIACYLEAEKEYKLGNFEYRDAVSHCRVKLNQWRDEFDSVDWFLTRFMSEVNQTIDHTLG
ncbi:5'-deoxynucleotidase [Shewanella gaetbuli]|uniref:5'-deoxynucleotidase n=1 Tax=Shewanella gaetbuli TaxID=220752 RepID=A0A9X1ZKA3_9GAMM|nr:5'-deoxynucleotidase [Shewanella gaetbuli]MCL1142542.1 5'-deoxynucleotidase [Shewanella gaetbuli]